MNTRNILKMKPKFRKRKVRLLVLIFVIKGINVRNDEFLNNDKIDDVDFMREELLFDV